MIKEITMNSSGITIEICDENCYNFATLIKPYDVSEWLSFEIVINNSEVLKENFSEYITKLNKIYDLGVWLDSVLEKDKTNTITGLIKWNLN